MTLNNLAEQLPWLLRNPKATRPTGSPLTTTTSSGSAQQRAGAVSSSVLLTPAPSASHSPRTAALISTFRRDAPPPAPSASSNFSTASTVVTTPRASYTAGFLPTPASTASTLVPSLRPTLPRASDAPCNPAVNRAMRNLPPPAFSTASTATDMSMAFSNTPSRRQDGQPELPQQPSLARLPPPGIPRSHATPAREKPSSKQATSAKTPSRAAATVASSHTKRAKTPVAASPFFDYPSDIDLDDFDSVVDLTTDDNIPSSSPRQEARDGMQLWEDDQVSPPEPSSSRRGKKRKSMDMSGSPVKGTPSTKRKAKADKDKQRAVRASQEDDFDDAGSIGDFPDVNDIVAIASSSPFTARQTPAKTPSRTPAKTISKTPSTSKTPSRNPKHSPRKSPSRAAEQSAKSVTPQKRQPHESIRSDVIMDSEDEFVTPPTRNASFVTCPNDSVIEMDGPPSPQSPTFRTASRVVDTPHKTGSAAAARAAKTPVPPKQQRAEVANDTDMEDDLLDALPDLDDLVDISESRPVQPRPSPPLPPLEEEDDGDATQRPPILSYWPALRWKQHGIEQKICKNAADYTKALREKSSPARRLQIKGEKEPLLKERQNIDSLVDEFKAYAALCNDQETLLNTITEAYQVHKDTEAEEARLDELSAEVQDCEDILRSRLSEAAINPTDCPAGFDAGSPHNVVVPATQHPEGFVPPVMSRNNAHVPENPSQVVLQTQAPPPREQRLPENSWDNQFPRPPAPHALPRAPNPPTRYAADLGNTNNDVPDYFDDDDLFNELESLPPMHNYGSNSGPSSAMARQENMYPPRRSPARAVAPSRGHDLFDDFSDDVEMLQVAEDFEMQRSSSAENTSRSRPVPPPPRQILAPTSGNVGGPAREPSLRSTSKKSTSTKKPSIPPELMRFSWSDEVRRALKDRFRMSGFRHNQLEAINATLAGKDAFVLMPTGGGKSLCYQLPAVIGSGKTSGVTIVLSPLLSLMQDQVDHLNALNIAASSFNSSTPPPARKHVLGLFSKPNPEHYLQLLYVTPEMINKSQQFLNGLAALYRNKKFARIVIDEAHCVSQWGHDFRPDYKALGKVRRQFPSVPVMALTATATPNVIVDIMHNLSIEGCDVFSQSFNRPNLYYELRPKGKGCIEDIGELINSKYSGQTGIVYTLSQKSTVSLAEKLRDQYGISAHHYHAGIPPDEKTQIQRDWQKGRIKVVVATIAFGMGIDKPDVRFVVHHYLPKSLEGYYQETGRAGRDGKQSDCYLYFGYGDIKNLRKFIDDSDGSHEQKERQRDMLQRIIGFCENQQSCRRTEILRYFGEDYDGNACNKTCDNCRSDAKFNLTDFTEYAVAALRIVQENNPITMVQCGDILMGKRRPEMPSLTGVYGIAKQLRKHDVHMMIYRLLSEHALKEENKVNKYDMAIQYFVLGPCARDYFSGRKKLQVVVKVNDTAAAAPKATKKSKAASDKADKAAKQPKAGKSKTAAGSSTDATSKKKKRGPAAAAVLDEAEVDDDNEDDEGDSEFEKYDGPVHGNGYAKDNFVVSDHDEDDEFDPPPPPRPKPTPRARAKAPASTTALRQQPQLQQYAYQEQAQSSRTPSRKNQTPQRQQRLEELGGRIAHDPRLTEANIDSIHGHIVAAFADEARRLEEKIRNEKGLRVLFTETHLREMAIGWTDSIDKMRRIRGIDPDHVRRYGPKFVPLVQRYYATYQDMMGLGSDGASGVGDESPLLGPVGPARRPNTGNNNNNHGSSGPSQADLDAVVDLISSDEDNDDEFDFDSDDGGGRGGPLNSSNANRARAPAAGPAASSDEAARWRAELETLQSQATKSGGRSGGGGSGGGSRKSWGRKSGGFRRGGGSRSGSASFRGRTASGASSASGVTKRKSAGASSAGRGGASSSRAGGGGGGGGSGIGMMPL